MKQGLHPVIVNFLCQENHHLPKTLGVKTSKSCILVDYSLDLAPRSTGNDEYKGSHREKAMEGKCGGGFMKSK
jgi:hypothetical protein